MNPNNKKIFLGIGVIILVLIFAISYMFLNQNSRGDTAQINNETIQPTEKIIQDTGIGYEASYSELPKNSDIQFKVGQKFIYKTPEEEYGWLITTYRVEKIERKNGKEYFVVLQEDNSTTFDDKERINIIQYFTYYYDKENGKVSQIKVNDAIVKDGAENLRATDMSFFAYWMLSLDDNANWEIKFTETTPSLNLVEHRNFEFRVLAREKVNNRECFKVEKRIINIDKKNELEEIDYYWVDVKKRILIKKEFYSTDKVKIYEMNIISEI